jgi:phenylalanyl-tRNA synthetase beta chain
MKISRNWLQTFFDAPLPDAAAIGDALTFHAFEIESIIDDVLDVKVTANRGHDCLCHFGIAKELSAICQIPLKKYPHTMSLDDLTKNTDQVLVEIVDEALCSRYIAGYIKGVKVGPSPDWLRSALESVGQRSVNNIVDATNYVMFNIGQPLHAFDAGQLQEKNGYAIEVRTAAKGEKILSLDDKEYALAENMLVIGDKNSGAAIGIAGVKGGKPAGITEATNDIIIESANFDGVSVRRTAAALKLRTDASSRFEQVISPELAAYGMHAAAELILQLAGGELAGFEDEYPLRTRRVLNQVSVSFSKINAVLGTNLTESDVADAFTRLMLPFEQKGDTFTVTPPFERLDLVIPEDLIEEVARIVGYDEIPSMELPTLPRKPEINANFYSAERAREELVSQGYSEVFTSVFADKGERVVANKVDGVRPYLRSTLVDGLNDSFEKNTRNKDLLGLKEVKLFEIGTVWRKGREEVLLGMIDNSGVRESEMKSNEAEGYEELPVSATERYRTFSKYPFIVRDIAMWVPAGTQPEDVLEVIRTHAGELLVRSEKFDEFKKGERMSYAFRLVFQSFDRTLTDGDVNERMESIYTAVKEEGWEVR